MSSDRVPKGFKQTGKWDSVLLGDLITLQRGFDLPSRLRCPGEVPIVSSSGVIDTHDQSPVEGPGVVTGRYGTIGEVFFVEGNYWPLNTTLFVNDFKDNNPLFIYFLLKTIDYKTYSGKSGVPGVNRNDLHEISVDRPPIEEQRSIAQVLSDVDALIAALDQLIAKKRHLKTATMQQLLTGKQRLPGFGEGKGYQQSAIGLIPEDWDVQPLKSLLSTSPKYGINAAAIPYQAKHPTYIRITDISEDGRFQPDNLVAVEHPDSDQYFLEEGDLVFARTGASVGKSYLYDLNDGKLVYAGFLIKIHPDAKNLLPNFLSHYVKTQAYWDWVQVMSMRSGQPGINGNEYGQLLLPLPLIEEQSAIAQILTDMDTEITAIETRRTKTQALKQGMMQELLTGRTRLK
jgi:type I restriction enzyme, S subunit